MNIDQPQTRDLPGLRQLWQEAFGDGDAFLDAFFQTGFAPSRCRCLYFSGDLAAALYWFDCTWENKKVAYLYAVATKKAYRGRGLCTALMEDTHRHLQDLGYHGAALVPGNKKLFTLYEKMGYQSFCPMTWHTLEAAEPAEPVEQIAASAFAPLQKESLPHGAVVQQGQTLAFLAAFCRFYRSGDSLFCLSIEKDTAWFQQYLGDPKKLPGILAALGVSKGVVALPGGRPYAMYRNLTENTDIPNYLGISLG